MTWAWPSLALQPRQFPFLCFIYRRFFGAERLSCHSSICRPLLSTLPRSGRWNSLKYFQPLLTGARISVTMVRALSEPCVPLKVSSNPSVLPPWDRSVSAQAVCLERQQHDSSRRLNDEATTRSAMETASVAARSGHNVHTTRTESHMVQQPSRPSARSFHSDSSAGLHKTRPADVHDSPCNCHRSTPASHSKARRPSTSVGSGASSQDTDKIPPKLEAVTALPGTMCSRAASAEPPRRKQPSITSSNAADVPQGCLPRLARWRLAVRGAFYHSPVDETKLEVVQARHWTED